MDAKKCDRCGVLYENEKNESLFAIFRKKEITTIATYEDGYPIKEYEVCPSCRKSFLKWLNREGEAK